MDCDDVRQYRGDLGCGLHALDAATRGFWATKESCKCETARLIRSGNRLACSLLILMLVMGVYPGMFLKRSTESVKVVQQRLEAGPATGGSFAKNIARIRYQPGI